MTLFVTVKYPYTTWCGKRCTCTKWSKRQATSFCYNFIKYWPMSKILSLAHSKKILPQFKCVNTHTHAVPMYDRLSQQQLSLLLVIF